MFELNQIISLGCDCSIRYQSARYWHQLRNQQSIQDFEAAFFAKKEPFISHFFDWVISSDTSVIDLTNPAQDKQVLAKGNFETIEGATSHRLGIRFPHHFEGSFEEDGPRRRAT